MRDHHGGEGQSPAEAQSASTKKVQDERSLIRPFPFPHNASLSSPDAANNSAENDLNRPPITNDSASPGDIAPPASQTAPGLPGGCSDRRSQIGKLSVLMPLYNERWTLETIIRRVLAVPLDLELELIVVDDGSSDGSWEELQRVAGGDGASERSATSATAAREQLSARLSTT